MSSKPTPTTSLSLVKFWKRVEPGKVESYDAEVLGLNAHKEKKEFVCIQKKYISAKNKNYNPNNNHYIIISPNASDEGC